MGARMEACKLGGIITGTLVGGFIAARWGLRAPMIAYVAPAAAAFLLALTLKEPPAAQPRDSRKSYRAILIDGGRYFLQHKILLLLAVEMAITNALAWGIIWLFQPLLARAGVALQFFGLVQAVACVTQILLLSNVEKVEVWLGSKRRLLIWGSVLTGAAFLLLGASQALPLVVLGIVVAFTFGLTRVPIFSSYLNKYIPSDKRATVLSMTSMLRTLAIVIMNPITGFLAERWLSWTLVGLGAALVVFPVFSRVEEQHLLE
jgi:MFS family permease